MTRRNRGWRRLPGTRWCAESRKALGMIYDVGDRMQCPLCGREDLVVQLLGEHVVVPRHVTPAGLRRTT